MLVNTCRCSRSRTTHNYHTHHLTTPQNKRSVRRLYGRRAEQPINKQTSHHLCSLPPVHEAAWDGVGCQQFVSLAKLLEEDAVREALPADANTLQHPIAPQLVQDEMGIQFASLMGREREQNRSDMPCAMNCDGNIKVNCKPITEVK